MLTLTAAMAPTAPCEVCSKPGRNGKASKGKYCDEHIQEGIAAGSITPDRIVELELQLEGGRRSRTEALENRTGELVQVRHDLAVGFDAVDALEAERLLFVLGPFVDCFEGRTDDGPRERELAVRWQQLELELRAAAAHSRVDWSARRL